MIPTPGTRIGPYEITAPIEGGMGVVFRARDTQLLRDDDFGKLVIADRYYKLAMADARLLIFLNLMPQVYGS